MQKKGVMMSNKKQSEKNAKKSKATPKLNTPDDIYKKVSDITLNRKAEIEESPELTQAICELANLAQNNFLSLVKDTIKTGDAVTIKKDTLLVLQLMYLKLSSDIVSDGKPIELTSTIPTSGLGNTDPIDITKNTVQMYL